MQTTVTFSFHITFKMVVNGQKKTTMSIKRIRQGCIINKQEVLTWFCKTERKRAD